MESKALFQQIQQNISGEAIRSFAERFRQFPLKLSYSSYAKGISFLAEQYRSFGLEAEVIDFPADGKTVYADRHFPLAWDVDDAWAETGGERIADYSECTYCVVPFSHDSGGVQESVIIPYDRLPETGTLEKIVPLITKMPNGALVRKLMARGCLAFMGTVDLNPIHPSLDNTRRWYNDLFGGGQIDCRDRTCAGFSLTPRIARELVKRYAEKGPIPVKYLMKTRTYEGKAPAVTAVLKGKSDRCFFITAHAYEPHATNNVAGVSSCLEIARTLSQLIREGKLPQPEYSIRFFHGLENFSLYAWGMAHREAMKNAVGGVSLDSFGRLEAEGFKEHFVLRRSLNIHPSDQHAAAREYLALAAEASGISFEVKEASKNNEDLMQDPLFGPAWNLFYGSLWEEPLTTYPRCYFYHTSNDTPDKLSPAALNAGASFAAALAMDSVTDRAQAERAQRACEDWKRIVRAKCLEALKLEDSDPELRTIRAQRLAAWRNLSLTSAAEAIGEEKLTADFRNYAVKQFGAAFQLLCGGEPPKLRSAEGQEVIVRTMPGPVGLGCIGEELHGLAKEALGYAANEYWCFDECGTNYYYFDGQRSVFQVALAVWSTRPYGVHETADGFEKELCRQSKLAELVVKAGLAEYKKPVIVTQADIVKGLRELGIAAGDTVMVHSGLSYFGKVEGGAETVIRALQEVITENGILALPALSTRQDGDPARAFDPAATPCVSWIGIIPETYRKTPGVKRSQHPTHSVCAWGKNAAEFLSQRDPYDTFAADGPWGKLRSGGKILFLGESLGGNTFLHACEAWFNDYLDSTTALTVTPDGVREVKVTHYPGGCRGGWYKLGRKAEFLVKLQAKGIFRETRIGKAAVTVCNAGELADAMREMFAADPAILLHKSGCADCARLRSKLVKPE